MTSRRDAVLDRAARGAENPSSRGATSHPRSDSMRPEQAPPTPGSGARKKFAAVMLAVTVLVAALYGLDGDGESLVVLGMCGLHAACAVLMYTGHAAARGMYLLVAPIGSLSALYVLLTWSMAYLFDPEAGRSPSSLGVLGATLLTLLVLVSGFWFARRRPDPTA